MAILKQSEADLQALVVSTIRTLHPEIEIVANPLSELQLHYRSERAKHAALMKAKRAGWKQAQCDLLLFTEGQAVPNLAIELKRPEKNPFRQFRSSGKMWIDETKDFANIEHVISQMAYLGNLESKGFRPFVLSDLESVMDAITFAIDTNCLDSMKYRFDAYGFSYGMNPDLAVLYRPQF